MQDKIDIYDAPYFFPGLTVPTPTLLILESPLPAYLLASAGYGN